MIFYTNQVFEYLVSSTLFANPETPGSLSYHDVHLARIFEMLGPFPERFLENCTLRAKYLNEEGELRLDTRATVTWKY
jgi:hypothetical protein